MAITFAKFILKFSMLLTSIGALATTFVNRPLGDVVHESPNIVRGQTRDSYFAWDKTGRKTLYTYTNFHVTEVLKGSISEVQILLRQPGGSKDGIEMHVPGTAQFTPDQDVVVLLSKKHKEDGSYDVPGLTTGKYDVQKDEGGQEVLVNALGSGAIYDPHKDPKTISYNTKIPLDRFRKLAQGDLPALAHEKQFKNSLDPAPAHVYEAEEKHSQPTLDSLAHGNEQSKTPEHSNLWIPVIFSLSVLIAAALIWMVWK